MLAWEGYMQSLRNSAYQALRSSESFFKADMVYLTKGNFWQMFGQGVGSALSLLLLYIFANYLPKETYGSYRYILSLVGLLGAFSLTGMNQAVAQAVANGRDGVLRASVRYQLKWNLAQLAACFVASAYYFAKGNSEFGFSFIIIGLATPVAAAFNTYAAFLDGKKNFRLNNLFSVGATLIYVLCMIPIIFLAGQTIWLIAIYALTTLVSSAIFYFSTLKLYHPPITEDESVLRYGRELTFIGFIGPVAAQIDKIILSHFWGATALAVYALAMAIPERVNSIIKSWLSVGFPKFSTRTPEEINQVFYTRILQGLALGFLCFIAYYYLSFYLFKYLLPQYLESLRYSQILALALIFALPNRYISLLFASQKDSKFIFGTHLSASLLRIGLYLGLGVTGGIMGLVTAHILVAFLSMFINILAWRLRKTNQGI